MKSKFLEYLKHSLLFTVIVGILAYLIYCFLPDGFYTPAFPFLLLLFLSISLIVHYLLVKAIKKRQAKFVNQFMLTTFLKLVFHLVVLVIYSLVNREDAINFIVAYFILYLSFSVFEMINILKFNKESLHVSKDE